MPRACPEWAEESVAATSGCRRKGEEEEKNEKSLVFKFLSGGTGNLTETRNANLPLLFHSLQAVFYPEALAPLAGAQPEPGWLPLCGDSSHFGPGWRKAR